MAYLPHLVRTHALCAACDTITRLTRNIEDMLRRAATERPMLACCWHHGADARACCHRHLSATDPAA